MNVAEAEKNFAKLVNQVYAEGISIDLERDDKVIARLAPAEPPSPLTVGELNAFLRNLPSLGGDVGDFAQDVRTIRGEFPAEANPWD
jgi:antitoxin (DNA-binding transcriptional repressor) of toxin-antitoxin stability system